MLGLVWIKCQPKFYCPLISHRARTLSVLHSGLRCLTFTTMALGPSLGLQGERKGGHNSVKEASSRRNPTAIQHWHQLLEAVMRAAVLWLLMLRILSWPPTRWATCPHLTTFFAWTSLVSLAYSLIFQPRINFLSQLQHPARSGRVTKQVGGAWVSGVRSGAGSVTLAISSMVHC